MAQSKIKVKFRTVKVGEEYEVLVTDPTSEKKFELSLGKYPKEVAESVMKNARKALKKTIHDFLQSYNKPREEVRTPINECGNDTDKNL